MYDAITPVCVHISSVPEKKQSHRGKKFWFFFTPRDWIAFFPIHVLKITLENYELVNYKQRQIFEILIHGPLREFISEDSFWILV